MMATMVASKRPFCYEGNSMPLIIDTSKLRRQSTCALPAPGLVASLRLAGVPKHNAARR